MNEPAYRTAGARTGPHETAVLSVPPLTATVLTTGRGRQSPSRHWLLAAAAPAPASAEQGVVRLLPGVLFGAVSIAAEVLHAALPFSDPAENASPLAYHLDAAPVFYSREGASGTGTYTVLVPPDVDRWWVLAGTVVHSPRAGLRMPAHDVAEPRENGLWWVVPPDIPRLLCPPDRLAALVTRGHVALSAVRRTGGDRHE